ncbi:hypothetical protein AURDEDRAFT_96857 [Auricularia subglabra TFB-10046 SS5]|nr:hypothetical protein AURDEDRAFT_96857 [Auricularia subglabra TFB-10046 SS5]
MQRWIFRVKAWLDESSGGAPPRAQENGDTSSVHEAARGEYDFITHEGDLVSDEDAVALARNALSTTTPHARSFSIDSVSTTMSGTSDMTSPTDVDESLAFISPFPSPSHATTPDLSLSTPDQSLAFDSPAPQHARNASYSVAGPSKGIGTSLMANKSLPDLRLGNLGFAESSAQRKARRPPKLPDLPIASPAHGHVSPSGYSPGFMGSGTRLRSATHGATPSSASNLSHVVDAQMSSVDPERNAYFRRFSVQRPPPGERSAQSSPLVMVVDAARGIYFALSQVFEALRTFMNSLVNESLLGVLQKVLHPARKFLSQLMDAMDRFDEQAKLPGTPAAAGRNVIQACKDSVSVFNKVVGVLHVQLSLVTAAHDPRYTRWLLLILHGSMAEVAVSWHTISEHGDAIQSLLKGQRSNPKAHAPSRSLVSPITKQGESSTSSPTNPTGWVRGSRRHAGSFSYKDVQLGRALPSTDAPPGTPPPLRRGGPSMDNGPLPLTNGLMTPSAASDISHTRDDSISSTFSQGFGGANGQSTPQPSAQQPSRQHLAASAVDQDFFTTMDETIDTASSVWSHLTEIIGDLPDSRSSFEPTLQNAQDVTRKLRDDLERIQSGSTPALRKTMWENANAFLKAVVQVVTEVKGLSEGQQVIPLAARKAIARLGQLTQEFAMFLQISSLAPSPTAPSSEEHHRSPQHQQQASLGRSRSARASSSEKLPIARKDVPMSAQPQQQAFKIAPSPFTRSNGRRKDEDG